MFGSHSRLTTSRADVVLITGTYVFPEVFPAMNNVVAGGATVIHIDLNAYEIAKNFPVDIGVVADPKTTLGKVVPVLERALTARHRKEVEQRVKQLTNPRLFVRVAIDQKVKGSRAVHTRQYSLSPQPLAICASLKRSPRSRE